VGIMVKTTSRKTWIRSAVAAAALAATAGTASAAQWVGTWDPVYTTRYFGATTGLTALGSPFYDPARGDNTYLYFSGQATFDSGSCGTSNGTWTNCTGWSITDIKLTVGEVTAANWDSNPLSPTYRQLTGPVGAQYTFTFANSPSLNPIITSMTISGGQLVNVSSGYHRGALQEPVGAGNVSAVGNPFTALTTDFLLPFVSVAFNQSFDGSPVAQFGWTTSTNFDFSCTSNPTSNNGLFCGADDARMTFTPAIPEPSTYALMGLGLAAVAVMRRRATRQPKQA
jgi:hypothetical protein